MAKLLPPFILCPLAERKEFLGISSDSSENKVILTIGKNIAIRYHVLEQKQEVSWISSRHWFTSRVVYCPDLEKYATVIDYTTIILFNESDSNLASKKKYKFAKPVAELKTTSLGTLVVFKNGVIKSLAQVIKLKERKEETIEELDLKDICNPTEEVILHTEIDEKRNQAVLIVGFANEIQTSTKCGVDKVKTVKVVVVDLRRINSGESKIKFCTTIQKDDKYILGCAVNKFSQIDDTLIYLCSDGFLYQELLSDPAHDNDSQSRVQKDQPSSKIAFLEKHVSSSNAVTIQALDSSSVIIYGCDPSEEGACVLIYDFNYHILVSKQLLKLYSSPPFMARVGSHIFVPVGLHVLALNLRLTKSRLSIVVGKHRMQQGMDFSESARDAFLQPWNSLGYDANNKFLNEDPTLPMIMDTDVEVPAIIKKLGNVYSEVKTLESDGQPESAICGRVVPLALEARNIDALKWIIEYFYDIPESLLISMLIFLMSSSEFENSSSMIDNLSTNTCTNSHLINQMLERNFDQRQLLQEFRRLDFETVKMLLRYFWRRMNELWNLKVVCDTNETDDVDKNNELLQIFKWTCVVFDAQYPQFVSKNETELIDKIFQFINEKFKLMEEVESLEPLLTLILSKISYEPQPARNAKYRVETVTFE